ncbi:MAG TPA: hypothetical protein VMX55_00655 [candidate division Zixibacteria bacterium]|nr:hypothetical protein [candidate division Zixibacteria bacterium]
MSNEQAAISLETQNNIITTTEEKNTINASNFQEKFSRILAYLKPNIFNVIITFVIFLVLLLATKKLGVSFLVGISVYILVAFALLPFIKTKFGDKLNLNIMESSKIRTQIIETTSRSTVLIKQNKHLIGISLLKIEWSYTIVPLNNMCDFMQEEGIQIQDCREGCYLVIRKKTDHKRTGSLEEQAKKLIKEIDKTILLTRKKFDMEFENMHLHLIKGQDNILTILNLGLLPYKFKVYQEMSDEDFENLRESAFETQKNNDGEVEYS